MTLIKLLFREYGGTTSGASLETINAIDAVKLRCPTVVLV